MKDEKLIILINGKGGSGKDTAVDIIHRYTHGRVLNISTIDPIKEAASILGWDGNKDDRSRKFLSDMKFLSSEYNDYPIEYIKNCITQFNITQHNFLFIHCREPENIAKLSTYIESIGTPYTTLLIKRNVTDDHVYGNEADDNVEDYNYEFTYENNNDTLDMYETDFIKFFKNIVYLKLGVTMNNEPISDTRV